MKALFRPTCLMVLALALPGGPALASGGKAKGSWPGYVPVEPPVVVNLASRSRARFLQIGVQFYVETAEDAHAIQSNMPLLRDRLILFFGGREEKEVRETASREALREQVTLELQKALEKQAGTPAIKEVLFTSFVIQ